jgi:phage tail-like protein
MPQFPANVKRLDPYKNFRFVLYFAGKTDPVLGVSKMTGLKRTTEVVKHRDGGIHNHSYNAPGRSNFEPITVERGVTHDKDFEEWAQLVWSTQNKGTTSLKDFRRDLLLSVQNERGEVVLSYNIYRCWVSEYGMADLDANANAVWIEHLKIENEGWERDDKVTIPTEQ